MRWTKAWAHHQTAPYVIIDNVERTVSFIMRWFLCSLGLWIAVQLFGYDTLSSVPMSVATFLLAGFSQPSMPLLNPSLLFCRYRLF